MVFLRKNYWANNPGKPDRNLDDHQHEYGVSFSVIVFDMFWLDGETADKDDKEDDVEEGEDMVSGSILTEWHDSQPLYPDDNLDNQSETEKKSLVQGGEVDTGIEGDEEDLLD